MLFRCTEYENPSKCGHTAQSFNILPPVMSAKVTTKNSSVFRYGEIEIVAKLPTGDWIVTGKYSKIINSNSYTIRIIVR